MSGDYYLTSIFCDDIRHEINGKISLMGIYSSEMYIPDFPYTLPKLCAYFELRVPPNLTSRLDAIISVIKGAEKLNTITLPIESTENAPGISHGKPYVHYSTIGGMEFPSMTFTEPVLIEVVAQIGSVSLVGGRLWVTKFPQIEDAKQNSEASMQISPAAD